MVGSSGGIFDLYVVYVQQQGAHHPHAEERSKNLHIHTIQLHRKNPVNHARNHILQKGILHCSQAPITNPFMDWVKLEIATFKFWE